MEQETDELIRAIKTNDTNTIVRMMVKDITVYPLEAAKAQQRLFNVLTENIIHILDRISRLEARLDKIDKN